MDCHIKQITVLNADGKPAHSSVDTGSPLPVCLDEYGEQGEVTNRWLEERVVEMEGEQRIKGGEKFSVQSM